MSDIIRGLPQQSSSLLLLIALNLRIKILVAILREGGFYEFADEILLQTFVFTY